MLYWLFYFLLYAFVCFIFLFLGPSPNTVPVQTWEPTPQTLQPTKETGGGGVRTMKPTVELPKVTGAGNRVPPNLIIYNKGNEL